MQSATSDSLLVDRQLCRCEQLAILHWISGVHSLVSWLLPPWGQSVYVKMTRPTLLRPQSTNGSLHLVYRQHCGLFESQDLADALIQLVHCSPAVLWLTAIAVLHTIWISGLCIANFIQVSRHSIDRYGNRSVLDRNWLHDEREFQRSPVHISAQERIQSVFVRLDTECRGFNQSARHRLRTDRARLEATLFSRRFSAIRPVETSAQNRSAWRESVNAATEHLRTTNVAKNQTAKDTTHWLVMFVSHICLCMPCTAKKKSLDALFDALYFSSTRGEQF